MKIGELARRTGCSVQAVRYYEQSGLLPEPARTDGNYRIYQQAHADRLVFIRNCRALDMTQQEIRALLRIRDENGLDCSDADRILDTHIGHVAERMAELTALQAQLHALRETCGRHRPVEDCAILRGLAAEPSQGPDNTLPGLRTHLRGVHVHNS